MFNRRTEGNRSPKRGDAGLVADHHRELTWLIENLDPTQLVGDGHVLVIGLEQGAAGDVFRRAIRVMRGHDQLLLAAQSQRPRTRENFDATDDGRVGFSRRHALGDPADEQAVVIGTGLKPLAPTVWQLRRALGHQQTALGRGRKQTPRASFLDQMFVVLGRLEPEQRQPEAVLSGRLAVTATAVAAVLRKNGHDLVREVNGRRIARVLDPDREARCRAVLCLGGNDRLSVSQRADPAGRIDGDNPGGFG